MLAIVAACGGSHSTARLSSNGTAAAALTTSAVTEAADLHGRRGPNPYAYLPRVPSFRVTSTTVANRRPLPTAQLSGLFNVPGGKGHLPGTVVGRAFPKQTKSFVVTMYDPQAPTGSGFWHWVVSDIPSTTTSLPADAGALNSTLLPAGAVQLGGDAGMHRYVGGAPPAGSGFHNYYITVSALDIPKSGLGPDATGAFLGFTIAGHTIARATMVCPTRLK